MIDEKAELMDELSGEIAGVMQGKKLILSALAIQLTISYIGCTMYPEHDKAAYIKIIIDCINGLYDPIKAEIIRKKLEQGDKHE